jgi:hypothetical protein
LPRNLA